MVWLQGRLRYPKLHFTVQNVATVACWQEICGKSPVRNVHDVIKGDRRRVETSCTPLEAEKNALIYLNDGGFCWVLALKYSFTSLYNQMVAISFTITTTKERKRKETRETA